MTKILVTGGAGYIGSVLVPALLKNGHEVIVLDNFMYRQTPLLDQHHRQPLRIIRGDVRNIELINQIIDREKPNFIFPLAGIVGAPACELDQTAARTTNLDAIRVMLQLADNTKIIFPNTNSGYGIGQNNVFCDETTPLHPISLYGRLKVKAETAVIQRGESIALRLATVFGASPRMRLDLLVNDMTYKAVTDGYVILFEAHAKRNFIHVRDVAKAFLHCMDNFDSMKGETYNVGRSDANLSKWELCEKIKEQVPNFYFVEAPLREDPDKRNYIVSNAKIEATGYHPDVSLQEGITELIKACQIIPRGNFSNV